MGKFSSQPSARWCLRYAWAGETPLCGEGDLLAEREVLLFHVALFADLADLPLRGCSGSILGSVGSCRALLRVAGVGSRVRGPWAIKVGSAPLHGLFARLE